VTAPALDARGLTVRFGGLTAVDRVDFQVAGRTLVGIIGPNGAGKTTFFNALSGVVRPTAGRLFAGGLDLTGAAAHAFARAGIARTFQTPRVFGDMTVARSVRFALEFAGRRRRGESARLGDVPAILEFIGLADAAAVPVHVLTPARQRLLEIGMALGTRPRVLLLDEVAAGLNEGEVLGMAGLIRRCRDELGLAVVWVEHAVAVLLRTVERVVVMHQGRTLADGPPETVARDRAVIEAYLGEPAGLVSDRS
jgi:branched-chain amino acid transport system ATP-binding protein